MTTKQPFATKADLRTFNTRHAKRYPLNLTFDRSHTLVLAPAGAGMAAISVFATEDADKIATDTTDRSVRKL